MAVPPKNASEYARLTLESLAAQQLGDKFSLGGAFGLLHYLDYHSTYDVDARWLTTTTAAEQEAVSTVIEKVLSQYGEVRRRGWGDVTSIELRQAQQVIFSFQIAHRLVQLYPSISAQWANVLLDSLADVIASKMFALVERGAPRDFRDIYEVCQAQLAMPGQCWDWWEQRQRLAGSDTDYYRARLAIETHLARISQHRPLEQIEDKSQRAAAQQVRQWFLTEFLDALSD